MGVDLVSSAGARAQISQIQRYNAATNTFYGKYGYLPGDMPAGPASQFGFTARGTGPDGNGLIAEGDETFLFWEDLSSAGFTDGVFNTYIDTGLHWNNYNVSATTSPSASAFLPLARIGSTDYLYVFAVTVNNYFSLASYGDGGSFQTGGSIAPSTSAMTVSQAYNIDKKIDDGLPMSGNVLAGYPVNGDAYWAGGYFFWQPYVHAGPSAASWPPASNSCFDNGDVSGVTQHYSVEYQNGASVNCALMFRMQGPAR